MCSYVICSCMQPLSNIYLELSISYACMQQQALTTVLYAKRSPTVFGGRMHVELSIAFACNFPSQPWVSVCIAIHLCLHCLDPISLFGNTYCCAENIESTDAVKYPRCYKPCCVFLCFPHVQNLWAAWNLNRQNFRLYAHVPVGVQTLTCVLMQFAHVQNLWAEFSQNR